MSDISYVHNDTEVKLTGRTAERQIKGARGKAGTSVMLHEITPVDIESGSWRKWVRMIDLYEIKGK